MCYVEPFRGGHRQVRANVLRGTFSGLDGEDGAGRAEHPSTDQAGDPQ